MQYHLRIIKCLSLGQGTSCALINSFWLITKIHLWISVYLGEAKRNFNLLNFSFQGKIMKVRILEGLGQKKVRCGWKRKVREKKRIEKDLKNEKIFRLFSCRKSEKKSERREKYMFVE